MQYFNYNEVTCIIPQVDQYQDISVKKLKMNTEDVYTEVTQNTCKCDFEVFDSANTYSCNVILFSMLTTECDHNKIM